MAQTQERILIVESDPEISDLIARQALKPLGYRVKIVNDGSTAIKEAFQLSPDVIIVNLNLPGLSGKDLMVALTSQGMNVPVIVVAERGMESDVIQAFRLGASDYLSWPIREAEVVAAVERVLKQVRARLERENLSQKLAKTNQELQRHVRELTTIFSIGKAVTSITDPRALFDKIVEGAVYVSEGDKGWLLLRRGEEKIFILSALRNMPKSVAAKIDQPWDDGISSLVALSGETLSIHGDPLNRFKVSQLGKSALVVPVKVQKEVVGLLVVIREDAKPFSPSSQTLLEALADYASISLVNVRLFQAYEERAKSLQKTMGISRENEYIKSEILKNVGQGIQLPLDTISRQVDLLIRGGERSSSDEQRESLELIQKNLEQATRVLVALSSLQEASAPRNLTTLNLVDVVQQAVIRSQEIAKRESVKIHSRIPSDPVMVNADIEQIRRVMEELVTNAIHFSGGKEVIITVRRELNGQAYVAVQDMGPGIAEEYQKYIFHPFYKIDSTPNAKDQNGLGIGLALAKEIIKAHGSELKVKSRVGYGSTFYFTLPSLNLG